LVVKDEGEDGRPESTVKREAYFLEFAGAVRAAARMPVMVTGNFRTLAGMVAALEGGELDLIGLGRPLISEPLTPIYLLEAKIERAPAPEASINVFHLLPWFYMQIVRLADGLDPDLALGGPEAAIAFQAFEQKSMTAFLERRGRSDGVPITAETKARTAKPV
jgi:hypothetical protein